MSTNENGNKNVLKALKGEKKILCSFFYSYERIFIARCAPDDELREKYCLMFERANGETGNLSLIFCLFELSLLGEEEREIDKERKICEEFL